MGFLKLVGGFQASVQSAMFDISNEHRSYLSSGGKCPNCQYQLTTLAGGMSKYIAMFSADGKPIPVWMIWKQNIFSISSFKCLKCGFEWKQRTTSPSVAAISNFRVVRFNETDRSQESLGDESRVIDNSRSPAAMTRKFIISREWSKNYIIEYEKADSKKRELSLGISEVVSVKAITEEALREQYSVSEGTKETATEEVEITVPAHTKLGIIFQWKKIWQNGLITLVSENSQELTVPYRIAVSITFDQLQYDANNEHTN
ncbi:hypothetical protein QZJ86_04315 [Methylomonas montana]|uniref:hypothetical protein n=1 Tax=Methylomonas montana TaxID=3058963 RepID=UPI002659BBD1|nr:hypothetical protein [Methylomonas montana]WKJ91360.1 hypothetical protein QZJ86_04315 [Methylomonas montana]